MKRRKQEQPHTHSYNLRSKNINFVSLLAYYPVVEERILSCFGYKDTVQLRATSMALNSNPILILKQKKQQQFFDEFYQKNEVKTFLDHKCTIVCGYIAFENKNYDHDISLIAQRLTKNNDDPSQCKYVIDGDETKIFILHNINNVITAKTDQLVVWLDINTPKQIDVISKYLANDDDTMHCGLYLLLSKIVYPNYMNSIKNSPCSVTNFLRPAIDCQPIIKGSTITNSGTHNSIAYQYNDIDYTVFEKNIFQPDIMIQFAKACGADSRQKIETFAYTLVLNLCSSRRSYNRTCLENCGILLTERLNAIEQSHSR